MAKATDKLALGGVKREIFGKKLKKMRHEGKIPANVYGPNFKSVSVTLEGKDFNKVYKVAEETGIVYLNVDKQEIPVLIKNVQIHPVNHLLLHVDLRKVDLTQKIETQVPIKVVGESPAVKEKGGVLLTQSDEVKVEALPQDIPHEIEVDISKLVEIGNEIKIADLIKNAKYEIKEDAQKIVVSVIAHKEESLTAETTAAAPEVITEKLAEGEEGAEAAPTEEGKEGKKPAEGKPTEGKPAEEGKETQGKGQKPEGKPADKQGKAPEAKKEEKK